MKRWLLLLMSMGLLGGCVTTTYRQADGYYVGASAYGDADTVIYHDYGRYPYGYYDNPYYGGYLPGFGYVPSAAYYGNIVYGGPVVIYRDHDRYHRRPPARSFRTRPRTIQRWTPRRPPPARMAERPWIKPRQGVGSTPQGWRGHPRTTRFRAPPPQRARGMAAPRERQRATPVRKAPLKRRVERRWRERKP